MTTGTGWRTTFSETMAGDGGTRPCELRLDVDVPGLLHPLADVEAGLRGRVRIPGLADDPAATGTLHIAPVARRRIRYRLGFTALDGRRLHLDGWKSVSFRHLLRSMTTLPATVTDESGAVVTEVVVRFDLRRALGPMLRSARLTRAGDRDDLAPRWDGSPGRLEVWYTTLTDPATGTGFWVHHELVAPAGGGAPHLHGWATAFPQDGPPVFARFGPHDWTEPAAGHVLGTPAATVTPHRLTGSAGTLSWDLAGDGEAGTLFTFPRWAWRTGVLPGAQVVPQPSARFTGEIRVGDRTLRVDRAPGATAHIYGHGNARRWAWLHADLGGGDVAEVVAAVSTRPGLRRLPPLPFVRLRVDGRDWPAGDPLLAALRLRADLALPTWRVHGRIGDHRLTIEVTQPPEHTVAVDYADPDGSPAVCRNTERADALVLVERRSGGRWRTVREWRLDGTAHAEVGDRA
ncbi:hypothetical protein B0I33_107150 [Prauserella shujinwangii]|uniref:Tocopherol cyclase-like protein n=1 Tax=Prauserella shujinwangii TaxID=1453103 RepID=A0A2T0LSH6_9PSEU|nr:hypothetical protein [Prauserella shujinwangii]PRX46573.1 hypothetical protein B0I33_107150 [Prauserella shujinwangii]